MEAISIEISRDMKWTVFIAGLRVLGASLLKDIPPLVGNISILKHLLEVIVHALAILIRDFMHYSIVKE